MEEQKLIRIFAGHLKAGDSIDYIRSRLLFASLSESHFEKLWMKAQNLLDDWKWQEGIKVPNIKSLRHHKPKTFGNYVGFQCRKEMYELLIQKARELKMPMSQVIRRAICFAYIDGRSRRHWLCEHKCYLRREA